MNDDFSSFIYSFLFLIIPVRFYEKTLFAIPTYHKSAHSKNNLQNIW